MFSSHLALSLPSVVTFSDGSTITYLYTADGRKLRTTHVINGTTTTTDYCGNVIYEGTTPKKLLTDEGYVDLTGNTYYYYYLKDHQGNNRVVINSTQGNVVETNHYYPFGGLFSTSTNVQPYKYNGKELDTKKGLNWYDYGARHYDAVLGRWHVVDPLAEDMATWSPYTYCFNNPMKFVDEEGKKPRIYVEIKGLGHTFVTTGEGKNTIVYTYGRYGEVDAKKSFPNNLSINGEGVLIIMKGDEAINYIKNEIVNKKARVYEFTNGSDEIVNSHFSDMFNASEINPSKGKYHNSENARVIDIYDLFNNNCTTKSAEAIYKGTNGEIDLESTSPSNIDTKLFYQSRDSDSGIERINVGDIIDEYELFNK